MKKYKVCLGVKFRPPKGDLSCTISQRIHYGDTPSGATGLRKAWHAADVKIHGFSLYVSQRRLKLSYSITVINLRNVVAYLFL